MSSTIDPEKPNKFYDDPYSGKSFPDKADALDRTREAAQRAIEAARRCLYSAEFKDYKKKYQEVEKLTVQEMIKYVNENPTIYFVEMCTMQANIRALRVLLSEVECDAKAKG